MKKFLACALSLLLVIACLAPCAVAEAPTATETPDCFKGTIPREDGVCPFEYLSKAFRQFFGAPSEANELYLVDAFRRFRANPDEETKAQMIEIFKKYIFEGEDNYYFMLNVFVTFLGTPDAETEAFLTRTFDLFVAPAATTGETDAAMWPPAEDGGWLLDGQKDDDSSCMYGKDDQGRCLEAPQDGGWLLGESQKDGGWLLEEGLLELLAENDEKNIDLLKDTYKRLLDEAEKEGGKKFDEWVGIFNDYFTKREGEGRCGSCWATDNATPDEYKTFLLDAFNKVIEAKEPEGQQFLAGALADIVGGDEDLYQWAQWEALDPAPNQDDMYELVDDFRLFLGDE